MFKIYPFIMCGGAGTRLWPLSTKSHPKQFHKIISQLTMLQETIIRSELAKNVEVVAPSFVCSSMHKDLVLKQCEEINVSPHMLILEPMAKNTAAVAAAIALAMENSDPEGLVLLLPADHFIENVPAFWSYVETAASSALTGNIVTFGIKPTHPETGYGYIKSGEGNAEEARDIIEFVEKPDLDTAKRYLKNGNYFWNAGIFLFKPGVIIEAFASFAIDILDVVQNAIHEGKQKDNILYLDGATFEDCRSESFDYAIMEKAVNISLVGPVDIGWNDIGSWRAVWEHEVGNSEESESKDGYCDATNSCSIRSSNILIRSSGQFVATVGVSNLAVIASEKAILIIDLESSQEVKKVVTEIKKAEVFDLM